jgi:hypothetical protein
MKNMQRNSEKMRFLVSRDNFDGFPAIILEQFNCPGWWFCDSFEQG